MTLEELKVWEALEVGPPHVEPRKLAMPYRVGEQVFELVYRYDEPVFDPTDPADLNLAALIGAQVALNYGLFARELRLHGPFTKADRQLLRNMAANTNREILVHKLLAPNPFLRLTGPLEVGPHQPVLRFTDPAPPEPDEGRWGRVEDGVLVLSSGGKDSLLSQGLLEELGAEVHPIFANESGRHWFTALNAFRHLREHHEHAARVWTNCDRLYGWALRQLPFVRQDYARVRADIYPLRLWTVVVFPFGVLPLMKRRGLGQIVVGDEFDTSVRSRHAGLTHYEGLYDQSRWFDEALSRFYARKGWGVVQYSVLRTASELVIMKALGERYPELQALQVSCHAAHVEGERVLPCGACEKCRRMVGMLVALGGKPGRLGYGPEQVTACLQSLAEGGVKQIADDAAQLAWRLVEGGHLPADSAFGRLARHHPETGALRFDPVASPDTTIPTRWRSGVHRILLRHAGGAVRRAGRSWVEHDPLAHPGPPNPFEGPSEDAAERLAPHQDPVLLGELTWPQARGRLREVDVALLPVGAVEQHGPHLPLDIDAWDAAHLAAEVARACSDPKPLVLPLIPYGVSYHHEDFPGTLTVSPETLARMVHEVGLSAARNGIRKLVIVNGHGGNIPALGFAAQMINRDAHIFTCVDTGETSDAEIPELIETAADVHAGECETSTALATRPELVHLEHAHPDVQDFQNRYLDFGSKVSVEWYVRTSRISRSGTMGDPTRATAEKGRRIWEISIQNLAEVVEHLKRTPLDQIHRPEGA